jgi:predicted dehydrogenase
VISEVNSHPIGAQTDNMIAAIRTGEPLLVDVYEGANCIAVCEAIRKSARTGKTVKPHRFIRPDGAKARYVETARKG